MDTPRTPDTMFIVNPELDTETLLAHACESLASANVMTLDLADRAQGTSRKSLLGIAQVIMSGELAVNGRWIDSTQLSTHVFWARGGFRALRLRSRCKAPLG